MQVMGVVKMKTAELIVELKRLFLCKNDCLVDHLSIIDEAITHLTELSTELHNRTIENKKLRALAENGQSAIDTNKRLARKLGVVFENSSKGRCV